MADNIKPPFVVIDYDTGNSLVLGGTVVLKSRDGVTMQMPTHNLFMYIQTSVRDDLTNEEKYQLLDPKRL
jgi:hypothetical protein